MKYKYNLSKVPRDLLENLVLADHPYGGYLTAEWDHVDECDPALINARAKAVREIRRAARVPLRTRAEVDADILRIFRANAKPCCMQVHKGVDKKVVKMCDNTHVCLHALLTEDCLDSGF